MADVIVEEGPKDLLVLIWVHGFKGNDVTFESFPDRVSHLLRETHPSLRVESHVFPMYQTRGELKAAVLAFVDWLTELIVRLENDHGLGGGAGKAKIVLMGHSMGGLLIADAARDVVENTREGDPLWPKIVGILAFDTPYLGLHPHTFKHHLSQAASYYEQARSVASAATMLSPLAVGLGFGKWGGSSSAGSTDEAGPSKTSKSAPSAKGKGKEPAAAAASGSESEPGAAARGMPSVQSFWNKTSTLYGLGAVALGAAAAGTAYYRREDFMNGWKWGFDHMTFVRNLWDDAGMKERLDALDVLDRNHSIRFRNYYSHLPPSPPKQTLARTFTILPPTSHPTYPQWIRASNSLASDEVSAHMGMFNPKTNDGFYELGLEVVHVIGERIEEEGVGRASHGGNGMGDRFSVDGGDEKEGWREEKDSQGRIIWVET